MAALWLKLASFGCIILLTSAGSIFDSFVGDLSSCQDVCENTFPAHTYEKAFHQSYCRRGCRLFSILEFVNDDTDVNSTLKACASSCKEAYPKEEDSGACDTGCKSQVSFASRRQQMVSELNPGRDLFYPFMYVHSIYSNMVDKMSHHMSVSWSYYMRAEDGKLVVIKSQPKMVYAVYQDGPGAIKADYSPEQDQDTDYRTSNYIETNVGSIDNSATPNLKHSQMHSLNLRDVSMEGREDQQSVDWLGCVSKKTGLPRLFLSFTIFISAMVMIWLCFTSAATAPEHRIAPQKLSIYGDLDYLNDIKEKGILPIHPQDMIQASPLPIKIKVERI